MSIFKRIAAILRSNKQPQPSVQSAAPTLESIAVGDIVSVDLEEYVVSGKVIYADPGYAPHRYAYYLQSGRDIHCLIVEKGRTFQTFMCRFLEGGLDDPNDVPKTLTIDEDVTYELESNRTDRTQTQGNTDFRSGDQVEVWRYFASETDHFYLQWQDGKFVALEGTLIPSSEVKIMKSNRVPQK
ncbi:DUF4178 domain-containing protein [Paenibacillus ginsengarvi]|uniref:DUF4178 domain-containing protein n=1 Tax=Paenibacillus ginsengarvi TaxID=400777 RepID=A0A3B0CJ25_9BACL|nr:DUF4178 domain-containing protein [Paenibacillus ginsengarvi]RKN85010.1 DUF4178 domain-containing protein [Paenibacillus ginsengarvi]